MTADPLSNLRILIIVPAFNESAAIAGVIEQISNEAPDCDIVVIDDGSTDGTSRHVPPGTHVIQLSFNLGIGGAMQAGYRYAEQNDYDVAVQVDGDGQHPAEHVIDLVRHLVESDADLAIGSRFAEPGLYEQTATRKAGVAIVRATLRLLTGKKFTDCTSGFRAVNKRVIQLFSHWYPDDYPEPEVCMLLVRRGCRIVELPVKMHQRKTGRSSIPFMWGVFYIVKVLTALALDLLRDPWRSVPDTPNDSNEMTNNDSNETINEETQT